jgi:hypothetical protein
VGGVPVHDPIICRQIVRQHDELTQPIEELEVDMIVLMDFDITMHANRGILRGFGPMVDPGLVTEGLSSGQQQLHHHFVSSVRVEGELECPGTSGRTKLRVLRAFGGGVGVLPRCPLDFSRPGKTTDNSHGKTFDRPRAISAHRGGCLLGSAPHRAGHGSQRQLM